MPEVHVTWSPTGGLVGSGQLPAGSENWSLDDVIDWVGVNVDAVPYDIHPDQMTWIMIDGVEYEPDGNGDWQMLEDRGGK